MSTEIVSLQERLAHRRQQLTQERSFDLPVPGYEDDLVARYHPLSFKKNFDIETRNDKNPDRATATLNVILDKLIAACDGLFSKAEDGTLTDLGHKWTVDAAKALFGIDDLDEGATARQAMLAIFPDTDLLIEHVKQYAEACTERVPQIQETLEGESEPSQEG